MKKRNRRIYYREYRALMKELRGIAYDLECDIRIQYKKPFHYGEFCPGVCGSFNIAKNRINIIIRGRPSRRDILYTLAHEVRHAMHLAQGYFPHYYKPISKRKLNLGVAVRAERDCDKWANKWLKSKNLRPIKELYPAHHTLDARVLHRRRLKNTV